MAGRVCPKCHRQTLWDKGARFECSNPECGYKVIVPSNGGKEGKVKDALFVAEIHGFVESVIHVEQRKDNIKI